MNGMKKQLLFQVLVILLINVTTCTNQDQVQAGDMPDIGVPANEINSRLVAKAPEALNDFKIGGQGVDLIISVISGDQVAFTHNFGARLFINNNGQWQEIANLMIYPSGYLVIAPNGQPPLREGWASVDPILPDRNKLVTVRIFVVGNIYKDGEITDVKTAAYVDVELKP